MLKVLHIYFGEHRGRDMCAHKFRSRWFGSPFVWWASDFFLMLTHYISILEPAFAVGVNRERKREREIYDTPGIPTTIRTMGVNITPMAYLRVLIIEIGSTMILMVVEAQGYSLIGDHHTGENEKTQHLILGYLAGHVCRTLRNIVQKKHTSHRNQPDPAIFIYGPCIYAEM